MKILIVDDCPIFLKLFQYTLSRLEYISLTMYAKNGLEAVAATKSVKFDLVILDLEMPRMDGFEAIPKIKENSPDTKIIVCSGLTRFQYQTIQKVLALGVDGVTSKIFQNRTSHELSMDNFRNELVPRIMEIYKKKYKESYDDIVEHSYAKNIIDGILVIHLIEKNRDDLTHNTNSIREGLDNINSLLRIAKSTSTPICIDQGYDENNDQTFNHLAEISEAVENLNPNLHYKFNKKDFGHSLDWVHQSMRNFIEKYSIVNLLIVGFNRTCCIKNASTQIAKYYKREVYICDDFLFGHADEQTKMKLGIDQNIKEQSIKEVKDPTLLSKDEVTEYLQRNSFIKLSRNKENESKKKNILQV